MGEMSGHIVHVDPESVGERQRSGADLLRDEQLRATVWHWKGIENHTMTYYVELERYRNIL